MKFVSVTGLGAAMMYKSLNECSFIFLPPISNLFLFCFFRFSQSKKKSTKEKAKLPPKFLLTREIRMG